MSEIPDVVPGEPVESSWGNLVRDRVVQRYADATARANLVPVPEDGAVSWLDDPGRLEVYDEDAAAWVWPIANNAGELVTLEGALPRVSIARDSQAPAVWELVNGNDDSLTMRFSAAGDGSDWVTVVRPLPNGVILPLGIIDGLLISGATGARLDLTRGNVATKTRFAIESGGGVVIQFGTDGVNYTTAYTFFEDEARPLVPIRMTGNTGQRLHYITGSGGTLTPDFEAVFDALPGSPFPTDQQLYRGGAAALRSSDVAAVTADADVATVEAVTARVATPSIDDLTPMVVETTAGKAGAVVEVPDTWELGGTQRGLVALLVAEVQELRARVAALEGP